MVWRDDAVKRREVCGSDKSWWMDAQTIKITDDKAFKLTRLYVKARERVLCMDFKYDAVSDDGR